VADIPLSGCVVTINSLSSAIFQWYTLLSLNIHTLSVSIRFFEATGCGALTSGLLLTPLIEIDTPVFTQDVTCRDPKNLPLRPSNSLCIPGC
jgi:hypothetical protein